MSFSVKSSFALSKFPELSLILVILALGLILAIFGGSVQLPKFETTPDGKRERAFETNAGIAFVQTGSQSIGGFPVAFGNL